MKWIYFLTPFWAWFMAELTRFLVNSARIKAWSPKSIGHGGMPSNHSAIVSAVLMQIVLQAGIQNPAFAAAMGLAFIVILDAKALRGQLGKHAVRINKLSVSEPRPLRERMGHTLTEIMAGILVGSISACLLSILLSL